MSIHSPGVSYVDSLEEVTHSSWLKRVIANVSRNATTANLIGLLGGIVVLFCLLVLPSSQYWNIRLPLYMVVVIWTLLRPRVALYLLPIAIPWGSLDTINVGLNLTSADILVALLVGSWLMSFALRPLIPQEALHTGLFDREELSVPRYLVLAMLALLLTMLLSMTTTFSLTSSLKELSKWLELVTVILLGVQYIRTRRQIWTLVVIICLAAISQAFLGYIQYFFNLGPVSFVRSDSLRVYGTFDQPNPYAGYIDMTLTLVIALTLLAGNWKTRILAGLTTALLAPMIVPPIWLTQSKGGIVAFTVALLFIVTLGMTRLRKLIGAGAIAVLAFVAAYLAGRVPDRLFAPILRILGLVDISFTAPTSQDFATAERVAHWIAGIRMFLDHPWLGVGIGSYPDAYPKYFITIFVNPLGHAHNYYINIAAETGLFGLIAFLLFLLAIFVAGGHSYRAISKKYMEAKAQRAKLLTGVLSERNLLENVRVITNDRALAVGLLASLVSVCTHNLVDNLYVHSMTSLFALLIVMLIRLEGVASNKT